MRSKAADSQHVVQRRSTESSISTYFEIAWQAVCLVLFNFSRIRFLKCRCAIFNYRSKSASWMLSTPRLSQNSIFEQLMCCSHSTLSCAEILTTAATALTAAQFARVVENGADFKFAINRETSCGIPWHNDPQRRNASQATGDICRMLLSAPRLSKNSFFWTIVGVMYFELTLWSSPRICFSPQQRFAWM